MPNVTVYIRSADMELWRALENKSEAISALLNESDYPINPEKIISIATQPEIKSEIQNPKINLEEIPGITRGFVPSAPDPNTGYSCCLSQTPCKHWTYNGEISAWENSLTGKTREVN